MKIKKLIIVEEKLLWDWKNDPFRSLREVYDMDWNLLFSFDPFDKSVSDEIQCIFK